MGRIRDALKKVPWKTAGLVTGIGVVALAILYFGLIYPDKATDPVARGGVAQHEKALHTPKTGLMDRTKATETALDDKAAKTDLTTLHDDLQAEIDLRPTKTDVTAEIGTAVGVETQARTDADNTLSALVESVVKALHDPANPGAGVVGRLVTVETTVNDPTTGVVARIGAVEAAVAPPPPVPPPDQVRTHVRHPVR